MKRPSFQFYPADWRGNANLRRCSEAARGAWMDILGTLHDSDEYGIVRWPLAELARAAGVALRLAKELVEKSVLKGADRGAVKFTHTPRHAGKDGDPVTLVEAQGPCWFSSRMVRDEWLRGARGASTRFTPDKTDGKEPEKPSPSRSPTHRQGEVLGDGSTTASSTSSAVPEEELSLRDSSAPAAPIGSQKPASKPVKVNKTKPEIVFPPWWPHAKWTEFSDMRREKRAGLTRNAIEKYITQMTGWRDEGLDLGEIIDQSVMKSYRGLFPVKHERNGHGSGTSNGSRSGASTAHQRHLQGLAMLVDEADGKSQGLPESGQLALRIAASR